METMKILERSSHLKWEYDEDADVLYISIVDPKKVLGVDIGEGVVLRYDEFEHEVVGLTLIGLRARLLKNLAKNN